MEPVSIIGITAAVVQFVDFTSKVLAEGYTLYTQTTKLLDQNRDVTQITRTLKESSKSLTNALDKQAQQEELTPHEVELRGLCARCHEVAAELLEALDQLSRNGSTTLFTTLYKALKSVRQKEFIDKLQKKIDGFRQELVMSMLVSLRYVLCAPRYGQGCGRRNLFKFLPTWKLAAWNIMDHISLFAVRLCAIRQANRSQGSCH